MTDGRYLQGFVYALFLSGLLGFLYGGYVAFFMQGHGVEIGLLGVCLLFLAVPTRIFATRDLSVGQQVGVVVAALAVVALALVVYLVVEGSEPQFGLAIALGMIALVAARH